MRSIARDVRLPVGAPDAFALLHTPSAIREWWSAAKVIVVPRAGGLWVATWGPNEDDPEYTTAARILVWNPPETTGFPSGHEADAFFMACERGWVATFEGIVRCVSKNVEG